MSRERPILFNGPMVRAIRAGTKTQTRRVAKLTASANVKEPGGHRRWHPADPEARLACPYGQPGNRLWVRERWDFIPEGDPGTPNCAGIRYWADAGYELRTPPSNFNPLLYGKERLRPSIHMPRWASRITLEVTGVRVERLHTMSRGDAMEEGCPFPNVAGGNDPRKWYADLWDSINGAGAWDANPWVWVVEFRRVTP